MSTLSLMLALLAAATPGWNGAEYAGMQTDAQLDELSGLAASHAHPGIYWANNDSGNGAALFAIRADGTHVADLRIVGASNLDWEDIASFDMDGHHYLLVADTGDNGGLRQRLTLYVIEEPAVLRDDDHVRIARTILFRWPDGPRDCEAVAVDAKHGEILLISKKRVPAELYRLPLRPQVDEPVAQLVAALPGIVQPSIADQQEKTPQGRYRAQVTGADLSADGRQLAVLTYGSVYLYSRTAAETWPAAFKAHAPLHLTLPWLPQAEAIAFSADATSLLVGGEQIPSPLIRFTTTALRSSRK
jgi:hypothetical protein